MNIILIIIGFVLLVKCADLFVDGASSIAASLGVSSLIIGLTIVAFGTSAPETAVSMVASIKGQNEISLGNVVGSNICNLLLVLGVSGLFGKLKIRKKMLYRDYLYSLFSYFLLFIMCLISFNNKRVGILDYKNGIILLLFLIVYLSFLIIDAKGKREGSSRKKLKIEYIIYTLIGLIGIIMGGRAVVDSASNLAIRLGVSDRLIALTIVAIGTSLPELVTSVVATKKGEVNIAIGNVLGSNIFNILSILGICTSINPLLVPYESLIDIIIMCVLGLIIFILIVRKREITKSKSLFMLFLYFIYLLYILNR